MARRSLFAIGLLALSLHMLGMTRSLLPAQDGLKYIRFAKRYGHEPWMTVVRGSDQHPLYSMLIAALEPPVALIWGDGPTSWRIAAQLVSVVAALATLIPLYGLSKALFGRGPALLATLIYVLLPIPAAIGRDTLSDGVALFFFATSMRLGEVALRTGRRSAWIGTGIVAGVGYLARPEILLVPVAVAMTGLWPLIARSRRPVPFPSRLLGHVAAIGLGALTIVGTYAMVKGEVSEKLAIRFSAGLPPSAASRPDRAPMPPGLDDPRWDFSPKEESTEIHIKGSSRRATLRLAQQWAEGLSWVMLIPCAWGVCRMGTIAGSAVGRDLVGVYLVLFAAIVVRHATTLGYLSGRHALTIVVASMPWIGAGIWQWAAGLPGRRGLTPTVSRCLATVGLAALIAAGVTLQVKAMHPSRWGHWAAGQWLRANAVPDAAVLDTRGWAGFIRGGAVYDTWHIRQALADPSLAYVVVGDDELTAGTGRARDVSIRCSPMPDRRSRPSPGARADRRRRPRLSVPSARLVAGDGPTMTRGTFLERLTGRHPMGLALRPPSRCALPPDLAETVMDLRLGRPAPRQARPDHRAIPLRRPLVATVSVYLKRHDGLPWTSSTRGPGRRGVIRRPRRASGTTSIAPGRSASGSPRRSRRARRSAPGVGSAGFLMVAELVGSDEVNRLDPPARRDR